MEFGGTDQKFNLLVGRDLQSMMGKRPQQCFLVPLLAGTDGVQKMSKSLGNYIGIDEPPNEIYGKTMSLPDSMILPYLEHVTDVPDDELAEMRQALAEESANPMDSKKRLARELVGQFHDAEAARGAEEFFERTVQRREMPDELATYELVSGTAPDEKRLSDVLVGAKLAASSSEARRLIDQGAVRIDDEQVTTNVSADDLEAGAILRVGRRRLVRLVGPGG